MQQAVGCVGCINLCSTSQRVLNWQQLAVTVFGWWCVEKFFISWSLSARELFELCLHCMIQRINSRSAVFLQLLKYVNCFDQLLLSTISMELSALIPGLNMKYRLKIIGTVWKWCGEKRLLVETGGNWPQLVGGRGNFEEKTAQMWNLGNSVPVLSRCLFCCPFSQVACVYAKCYGVTCLILLSQSL